MNKNDQNNGQNNKKLTRRQKMAIPFFVALAVLSVVAFIFPLRPTQSMAEKRMLKEFPSFTPSAFFSGEYFSEISLWFADTFPGRDQLITVSQQVDTLHGLNHNRIHMSSLVQTDDADKLDAVRAAFSHHPVSAADRYP